jgi:hypothetical protein
MNPNTWDIPIFFCASAGLQFSPCLGSIVRCMAIRSCILIWLSGSFNPTIEVNQQLSTITADLRESWSKHSLANGGEDTGIKQNSITSQTLSLLNLSNLCRFWEKKVRSDVTLRCGTAYSRTQPRLRENAWTIFLMEMRARSIENEVEQVYTNRVLQFRCRI